MIIGSSENKIFYEIVQKIASSRTSVVYKGIRVSSSSSNNNNDNSINTNQPFVCLKKVSISCYDDQLEFEKEVKIHKECSEHKNVVKVIDSFHTQIGDEDDFESTNEMFLVTEFCPKNLRDALREEKITFDDSIAIIFQVLTCAEFLHKKGIVHRDFKPENLLMDIDKTIKLCDFSISCEVNNEGNVEYDPKIMTLQYAPIELLLGDLDKLIEVDSFENVNKFDMWSIGVIFYELLAVSLNLKENKFLFDDKCEFNMIISIFQKLGKPNKIYHPNIYSEMENFSYKIKVDSDGELFQVFKNKGDKYLLAYDLLKKLLDIENKNRISSCNALKHKLFSGN